MLTAMLMFEDTLCMPKTFDSHTTQSLTISHPSSSCTGQAKFLSIQRFEDELSLQRGDVVG